MHPIASLKANAEEWAPAAIFLGPPGTGKSHLAQAIGRAVIQQGVRVFYRETYLLLEELADATLDGTRKEHVVLLTSAPLLIVDDLGMKTLQLRKGIRTRDDEVGADFDRAAAAAGTRVIRTAVRAPDMDATCERFLW
jgi:chromosomal replication initiation ATPase DnaA